MVEQRAAFQRRPGNPRREEQDQEDDGGIGLRPGRPISSSSSSASASALRGRRETVVDHEGHSTQTEVILQYYTFQRSRSVSRCTVRTIARHDATKTQRRQMHKDGWSWVRAFSSLYKTRFETAELIPRSSRLGIRTAAW